jgi:hypothetical protein
MADENALYDMLTGGAGEGQSLEFKSSLAEADKAIQTMVAFANSRGGYVFFGIKNDGQPSGAELGDNSREKLATKIRDQTYPSLPVFIHDAFRFGGADFSVLCVEVPDDNPPVAGVYLYSSKRLSLDEPIQSASLQSFRRAGRVTLQTDFMQLRKPQVTDPRVRISLTQISNMAGRRLPDSFQGRVWVEEGSATAHDISIVLDPPVCSCEKSVDDLPSPLSTRTDLIYKFVEPFGFQCQEIDAPDGMRLIARYRDDAGLVWEASRDLGMISHLIRGEDALGLNMTGRFSRRIVEFPAKRTAI